MNSRATIPSANDDGNSTRATLALEHVFELLRGHLVELVADAIALNQERLAMPARSPVAYFDRDNPPPGMTWRAALEHGRAGDFPMMRVGRKTLVARSDWERWAHSTARTAPKRARKAGPALSDRDEAQLERLGLVVPIRGRRG